MSDFANKVWWTKKSRIKAESRLIKLDFYSQSLLLWYSFFLVCYSIFSLVKPAAGNTESAVMISLSVLVLIITLFISNRKFKERAMLMKQCYEQLSVIYTRATTATDFAALDVEYQSILSISENHSEHDYCCALVDEYKNTADKDKLSKLPTKNQLAKRRNISIVSVLLAIFLFFFPILVVMALRVF
ncbi:SLATT domain-containing protein [Serratia ureilytica]|uniref:SLATT domain-containing protein n=1 Tax=Serratia ureilytica TaxID=300181 RepID=UPI0023607468|nr:SLATT domain-containing protein [Serratia ureilytica]